VQRGPLAVLHTRPVLTLRRPGCVLPGSRLPYRSPSGVSSVSTEAPLKRSPAFAERRQCRDIPGSERGPVPFCDGLADLPWRSGSVRSPPL
jgi:hypothetical protein